MGIPPNGGAQTTRRTLIRFTTKQRMFLPLLGERAGVWASLYAAGANCIFVARKYSPPAAEETRPHPDLLQAKEWRRPMWKAHSGLRRQSGSVDAAFVVANPVRKPADPDRKHWPSPKADAWPTVVTLRNPLRGWRSSGPVTPSCARAQLGAGGRKPFRLFRVQHSRSIAKRRTPVIRFIVRQRMFLPLLGERAGVRASPLSPKALTASSWYGKK